jgi:SAM-dependent methyltransferase
MVPEPEAWSNRPVDQGEGYDAATYGAHVAAVYDEVYGADPAAVTCLAQLAGGGRVLELGVGTGRLALPLAATGLKVQGIDASEAMVDRLRAKPNGDQIPVTIGDFADVSVDGEFALVFVAFNTFFVLLTPDEQARCLANVTSRLAPGGRFVLEAFVPDPSRFVRRHHLGISGFGAGGVQLNVSGHDRQAQRVESLVIHVSRAGDVHTWPVRLRYSYPTELDAMAAAAGLTLEHRWSSWQQDPFDADSSAHVSVYVRG